MSGKVRRRILDYLRERGSAPVYQIARDLGISYGAAQWHLYVLEREGEVFTVLEGRRRVVMLRNSLDAYLYSLDMTGFFKELWQFLRSLGVEGSSRFVDVVKKLESVHEEIALAILTIVKNLYYVRSGEKS